MPERKLVDIDQAQTYTAPNGAQYRLRVNSAGILQQGGTTVNPAAAPAASTNAIAMWKASNYDGGSQFLKDTSGNGHHLRLGSSFPAYIAKGALHLPGVDGNYASGGTTTVTGDIDVRVKLARNWDASGSPDQTMVFGKWGGTNNNFRFDVWWPRTLAVWVSTDGTNGTLVTASTPLPSLPAGAMKWIRFTRVATSGVLKFYYSDDGVQWTQSGTDVTGPTGNLYNSTLPHYVGHPPGAGTPETVYFAEVRSGIDGTVVVKFDPSNTSDFTTSFQSLTGETWTINRPGANIDNGKLKLPGTAGAYATVPDSAALDITGDIDVRARLTMDDWTPATDKTLVSKYLATGDQRAWQLWIGAGTTLRFSWSTAGTSGTTATATATVALSTVGITDGSTTWVRATLDVNNGATQNEVKFWYSSDGNSWTQLGATVTTAGVTSIYSSTAQVGIGAQADGADMWSGAAHRVVIKNGIDGTTVLDADFASSSLYNYTTTFTCTTGQTVTLVGQTSSDSGDPKYLSYNNTKYLYLPGVTSNSASTNDGAALDITGDIDIRVKVALDDWSSTNTATGQTLVAKWVSAGQRGWWFGALESGLLSFEWSPDGTTIKTVNSTQPTNVADGAIKWVRVTLDVDNGATGNDVKFWLSDDGTSWSQLGTTVTGSGTTSVFTNTAAVEIGVYAAGAAQPAAGKFYRALIKDGINGTTVYDADFSLADPTSTTFNNGMFAIPANRSTFTRTSTAYLDGVQVASNNPRYALGRNRLAKDTSDLETGDGEWSTTADGVVLNSGANMVRSQEQAHGGSWSMKVTRGGTNGNSGIGVGIPIIGGKTYTFSAWVNVGSLGSGVAVTAIQMVMSGVRIDGTFDHTASHGSTISTLGVWTRLTFTRTFPTDNVKAYPALRFSGSHGTADTAPFFYVDDVQLEETASASEWRAGGNSSVVIEEATTNILSAAASSFEGSGLANAKGTASLTYPTTSPFEGSQVGRCDVTQHNSSPEGDGFDATYSHSIPAGTAATMSVYVRGIGIWDVRAVTSGTGGISSPNPNLVTLHSGWQRVILPFTHGDSTSYLGVRKNNAGAGYIELDGWQVETKPYVTSWQIGGTARVADTLILPVNAPTICTATADFYIPSDNAAGNAAVGQYSLTFNAYAFDSGLSLNRDNGGVGQSWRFHYKPAGIAAQSVSFTYLLSSGHHQATIVVRSTTQAEAWIDGVLRATLNLTGGATFPTSWASMAPLQSGSATNGTGPRQDLDAFKVVRKALTTTEIAALWTSGNTLKADSDTVWFQDYASTLAGQYGAVTTINRSSGNRKSVIVDRNLFLLGTDDFLEAPDHSELNISPSDSLTVAVAYRYNGNPNGAGGGQDALLYKDRAEGTGGSPGYSLRIDDTTVMACVDDGGVRSVALHSSAIRSTPHIAILKRDVTQDRVYAQIAGGSSTFTGDSTTGSLTTTASLRIGSISSGGDFFDGEFIGAAIWRRALTDAEISFLAGEFGV